ncbi:hypothetical protein H2199_008302 [Coniosporium tulheliwenetii]|uniref:Uncharacterized protein n=1 Tax=Coniosporium tulheliwenetii TaxID=3383036 RepID=A0ACC2YKR6_9PEZI|nr:hypothetical protein H2199_008302 [Cladosporium sp. JES 115]
MPERRFNKSFESSFHVFGPEVRAINLAYIIKAVLLVAEQHGIQARATVVDGEDNPFRPIFIIGPASTVGDHREHARIKSWMGLTETDSYDGFLNHVTLGSEKRNNAGAIWRPGAEIESSLLESWRECVA